METKGMGEGELGGDEPPQQIHPQSLFMSSSQLILCYCVLLSRGSEGRIQKWFVGWTKTRNRCVPLRPKR